MLDGRKAEILLIEDNMGDELLTVRAFKNGSIETIISVAGSAEEAWGMLNRHGEYCERRLPDLILMDLNLPKMSGRSLLLLIKEDPDLKHIPVIVMTSSEATSDVKRCYDLHASAYIVKPYDLDAFKSVVTTIEAFYFTVSLLPLPNAA
jgi:CheY-like chemotaxis protein